MKTWLFAAVLGLLLGAGAQAAETMRYEEPNLVLTLQSDDGVTFVDRQSGKRVVLDQYGRWLEGPSGVFGGGNGNAWLPAEPLKVGLAWESVYVPPDFVGTDKTRVRTCKVASAQEMHTTPAGTFSTWKVECYNKRSDKAKGVTEQIWFTDGGGNVPALRLVEYRGTPDDGKNKVAYFDKLLDWKIDGAAVASAQ